MPATDDIEESFNPEERYRLLVDAVTDYAIYMLDPNGVIVSWNSGAQRLKGYDESEIVGQHFSRFYADVDVRAGLPLRSLSTAECEGRFEAEGWRIRKNGERFWAHVVIDPIRAPDRTLLGYAKVTRDLTERRAAEETLRRSEEQFKLLVQSVTDYAIYMLGPDGVVTNWNAGAERIKGYAPHEVVGTHFSRFYRDEDRALGLPETALATAATVGRFESEGWRVRKDGTQFWANVVVDRISNADGDTIGFAKVTRDVTEQRESRIALEQAREALFESQKLDALGQLTGGVAHDFNNLLMVVLSSLDMLKRRHPDDERSQRLIGNAIQGAKRGVTLTQRLLAFARRQQLEPVVVQLRTLVRGMQDMLAHSIGADVRIELDFSSEPRPVLVDANQFELAILNLVVNARDAMPNGGTVKLSTRWESVESGNPKRLATGDYVILCVADTGGGMSPEVLARAMEPFFTTKGVGKGTGLGLPMVHGLAAQSGGQFVLNSVEGVGTKAEIWLPVVPDDFEPQVAKAVRTGPAVKTEPMVVVAVDDDALVLAGTVAMLEDLGHTVLAATSAQHALDLVRSEPRVDLVITDHVMPLMSGAELIAKLKEAHLAVPVILATGYAKLPAEVEPAIPRLSKPFDQSQLVEAVSLVSAHGRLGSDPPAK